VDSIKQEVLSKGVASPATQEESPQVTLLVERAKRGEAEAFDALMRLYERRIIAVGVQMGLSTDDALDACQDTFVKVFRYIHRFRSGELFYRWLYRIAVNAVYDHLQGVHAGRTLSMSDVTRVQEENLRDPGVRADASLEATDLVRKALAALDSLSRQERITFILRDLQQIATQEIGRILGLSQVTVRRHCMSARQKLRDHLLSDRVERKCRTRSIGSY
jgi:RNA polymerase sigma-70 factor (ECF subfamily)